MIPRDDLVQRQCPACGIDYAAPSAFFEYRRGLPSDHKNAGWYCPNGHSLVLTESTADRERRRAERAEQKIAQIEEEKRQAEDRARRAEAARAKAEAESRRVAKRAHHGVCQCCNRTFANVARHMKTKHPDVLLMKKA